MNVYAKQKQTHRYRKQTSGYQQVEGRREGQLGVWNQEVQTAIYIIDMQQGYIVQHKELQLLSCNNF